MKKNLILIAIITVFVVVNIGLLRSNLTLKERIQAKKKEFDQRLESERENIRKEIKKDLEEKYRADIISYQAIVRRMKLDREMRRLEKERQRPK